jgi:hypothetical protein
MKATLVNRNRFIVLSRTGRPVIIEMELFKIPDIKNFEASVYPEGYRFGWIGFDAENPKKRILFDSHPPKGAHFHIDDDSDRKIIFRKGLCPF